MEATAIVNLLCFAECAKRNTTLPPVTPQRANPDPLFIANCTRGCFVSCSQPAARRCLSETSWEDRCLPQMGTAAQAPGRLSESSWEDRCLPTLVPAKLVRHSDNFSWEDSCLPSLSTVGTGSLSELAWEDRFLP